MNKNIKRVFFVTTLILLLVGLSAISAADASNDTRSISQQSVVKEVNVEKVSDNTITDTTSKNIKKDEQTTDLYVSDTSGSDDNSGTNTSPYKTIQKALDTTNADSTFNIHIAEGTYKGLGNTNLTVNGNYNINIIGDGINKTILDGEANYTIRSGDVWGSDSYWNAYTINYGNWGFNISTGTGKITIANLNIQHMVSRGGSSISAYETATVDNYANLEVNKVYFLQNLAGVGAGIRNNANATLLVNNSIFEENRKSSSTGNYGAGVYNNATATIVNSQFIRNAGRWGTITNDRIMNIVNVTIQDSIAYELGSTYKGSSSIYIDTSISNFFETNLPNIGVQTNIENSTFKNNGQSDIYQGPSGFLTVKNNIFNESTGIYISSEIDETNQINYTSTIINNQLINLKASSILGSLSGANMKSFGICQENIRSTGLDIINNTISLQNTGYSIRTTSNSNIINNTLYSYIKVVNDTIIDNNSFIVNEDNTIECDSNNTIINNYLESCFDFGDKTIKTSYNNTIENNTPLSTSNDIIITDETYSDYFDENGHVKDNSIPTGSTLYISGNVTNKKFIFDDIKVFLKRNETTAQLINSSIITSNNGRISMNYITINNTNPDMPAIILNSSYNKLTGNTIIINTTEKVYAIEINDKHNVLDNNRITLTALSDVDNDFENIQTAGIYITSSDNTIKSGNIIINDIDNTINGSIAGIIVNGLNNENPLDNNQFEGFPLTINNAYNGYGLIFNNAQNTMITNRYQTTATISSTNYCNYIVIKGNSSDNNISMTLRSTSSPCDYVILNGSDESINNTMFNLSIASSNRDMHILRSFNVNNLTFIPYLSHYSQMTTNSSVFELNNTNNSYISSVYVQSGNDACLINLINSNNNTFTNLTIWGMKINLNQSNNNTIKNITSYNSTINLINSNHNNIVNSTIRETREFNLINSTKNNIVNNFMNNTDASLTGDDVVSSDNEDNNITNNRPKSFILTMDNYNNYFDENNQYSYPTDTIITLGSDIYNKNMIINSNVTLENQANYTIYNSTLTLNEISKINKININNSQIIAKTLTIGNSTIYNSKDNTRIFTPTTPMSDSITLDNSTVIIQADNTIIFDNINRVTLNHRQRISGGVYNGTRNNITINGNNNTIIYSDKAQELSLSGFENITVIGNNNILFNANNVSYLGTYNNYVTNDINIEGNNNTILLLHNSTLSFRNTTMNISGENNIVLKADNLTGSSLNYNNITVNATTSIPLINIENSQINITSNNITTTTNAPAIIINNNEEQSNVKTNYIITNDLTGNYAVDKNGTNTFVTKNIPQDNIITNENYNQYFEDGILIKEGADLLTIGSDIYNKNMTFQTAVELKNPYNYTLYNSTITIKESTEATNLENLIINNTDYNYNTIESNSKVNIINMSLYQKTDNTEIITATNLLNITYSNINIDGENNTVIKSNNRTIIYSNNIHTSSSNTKILLLENYTQSDSNITYNNITTIGNNNIQIYLNNYSMINNFIKRASLNYNNIINNGTNNTAIYFTNTDTTYSTINQNNITVYSDTPTTAIIIDAPVIYLASNTIIVHTYNNQTPIIKVLNAKTTTMGVGMNYIESYDLCGDNAVESEGRVYSNNPTTTNYRVNITIENKTLIQSVENIIHVNITDLLGNNITGNITATANNNPININNNQIIITPDSNTDLRIRVQYKDPNGKYSNNNTQIIFKITTPTLTVDPITATAGQTVNITAKISADNETITTINKGKVTFKVNGKTLKDENGKVIYAKVVNGTATIENYEVPDNWAKDDTTIQAVYSRSTQCDKLSSEKQNITVTQAEPTLTITPITDDIQTGSNITLKAKVAVGDKAITTGKIVFKINGKTVKDENGKVIYAKVDSNGEVSIDYTIPESYKKGTYTIEATFIAPDYDKIIANTTMSVVN